MTSGLVALAGLHIAILQNGVDTQTPYPFDRNVDILRNVETIVDDPTDRINAENPVKPRNRIGNIDADFIDRGNLTVIGDSATGSLDIIPGHKHHAAGGSILLVKVDLDLAFFVLHLSIEVKHRHFTISPFIF